MTRIRSSSRFGIAAALVLTTAACGRDEPVDTEFTVPTAETAQPGITDDRPADLIAAQQDYLAAWNGSDADAAAAYFADDATAIVGDETYTGIAAIRDEWIAENIVAVGDLEATPESITRNGDEIVEEGTYSHTVTMPEGDVESMTGRYSVTWSRSDDGAWRITATTVQPDAQ